MRSAWIGWSGAAFTAALTLLAGGPLKAADDTGVHYVAEELGNRTKTPDTGQSASPDAGQSASKGLSDSAVRVMSTFALSILPDQVPAGPGGQMIKLDKSDPNKYLIPLGDARQVIRVATRSAYAEVCKLPELERANFDALIRSQKLRGWTAQQMMFIHALHTFATSYFAGNVKITEQADSGKSGSLAKEGAAAANAAHGDTTTITSKKLECAPGQKEKVTAAINTYVQSAPPPTAANLFPAAPTAPIPQTAPATAPAASTSVPEAVPAPVAGGAN